MQDWVFGCDVCQDVCPWNNKPVTTDEPALQPREEATTLDLLALFGLDDTGFKKRFRDTPLWRPKRRGILRNAAIVLGNQRASEAIAALIRGLNDEEPLVRGACAWALGQIGDGRSRGALCARLLVEQDFDVRTEIEATVRDQPLPA
jgi:epoxyqueuosine reductase